VRDTGFNVYVKKAESFQKKHDIISDLTQLPHLPAQKYLPGKTPYCIKTWLFGPWIFEAAAHINGLLLASAGIAPLNAFPVILC